MSRLDRLVAGKQIAQAAAVIGREFTRELLSATVKLPEEQLVTGLDELERAGLIFRRGSDTGWSYMFKHALLRDAAYASLLRDTRRERHAQVARALESTRSESTPPELVARHYSEANLHDAALRYWTFAGARAAERAAHREAISHYENALEALEHTPEKQDRAQLQVQMRIKIASSMRIIEKVDAALQILRETQQIAIDQGLDAELAEIHNLLGNLYFPRGNVDACLEEHRLSLHHARAAGAPRLEVRALGGIGDAQYARGRFQSAQACFEQCLALCRENAFDEIQAAYLPMAAYILSLGLDLDRALGLAH